MVRTAACAERKAVAAKAPRKALGNSSGGGASSSNANIKANKYGDKYGGGNSVCPRPVPKWQKGMDLFVVKKPRDKENESPSSEDDICDPGPSCSSNDQAEVPMECDNEKLPHENEAVDEENNGKKNTVKENSDKKNTVKGNSEKKKSGKKNTNKENRGKTNIDKEKREKKNKGVGKKSKRVLRIESDDDE